MHDHHNDHIHIHPHNHSTKNIKTAFFLNLSFTLIEIVGGLLTNSIAVVTDAVHDLGDTIMLGSSWYLENISKRKRTSQYSYGYTRFSLLAAIININVLIIGSIFVIKESVGRLLQPEDCHVEGMFLMAILGIAVNGVAVLKLKQGNSMNERVVMLHLMEDVLGWLAILIGSIVMYFYEIPILDPIMSLGIACYILYGAYKNLKQTLKIFLQGVPGGIDIEKLSQEVMTLPDVLDMHDTHVWSLDGDYNVLTAHVIVAPSTTMQDLSRIKKSIHVALAAHNIPHATLEFELQEEDCHLEGH